MKFSRLTLAVTAVLGAGMSSAAFAIDLYVDQDTQQIFAQPGPNRVKLGTFEKVEEASKQKAELEEIRNDLALKNNELKALDEHMKEAEQVKVKMDKKGLQVESADKNFKFKLGGRIHADASFHSGDDFTKRTVDSDTGEVTFPHVEANDGTEIRRARMEFQGTFFKDWEFRTVADFADDNVRMKDVWLRYAGFDWVHITAGQQKQNFSRELYESSNDLMFTERSLMNILNNPTVDRAIGLNLNSKGENWTAALGVFGDSITPNSNSDKADEGWGISSRVTYAPIQEKTKLVHLGLAGNYRVPDDDGTVAKNRKMRLDYETTNMSNLNLIDTNIDKIKNIKMLGLEAAGMYGPFSAGAEYTRSWIDREDGAANGNLELDGWYAEAAWTITGESRKYKEGVFKYLEPNKPFSLKNGGLGAWELATRYSTADLNDGGFHGGEISNVTVALNWYINSNFRMMADYTRVLDIENSPLTTPAGLPLTGDNIGLDTYMLRGQVAF
ncbi:OprO/OprP family phosphate-selective porin [Methylobacter sp. sgz302048]|uniref:OprO/OprP family phosphate-selective porin n=1 Tax=Methylobacter sp. sgz302048 TaxID=3455945 RepID=UPI003FA0BF14